MPFCPKCRYEYVEGITKCEDCGTDLVESLPETQDTLITTGTLVSVASFMYPPDAEMARLKLDLAGIESIVANEMTSMLNVASVMSIGIRLLVKEEDAEKALEALNRTE
jgi:hypothetical protein